MTLPLLSGRLEGKHASEVLVLGPSLGTSSALWFGCAQLLQGNYQTLRFDLPGHGAGAPARESLDIKDLADAVIVMVDSAGIDTFHYAGISLGGAIGLELAIRYPARLSSFTVVCSAPKIGSSDQWLARAELVRTGGTQQVVSGSAQRWFAPGFIDRDWPTASSALAELTEVDDESYALCCEALARFDATGRIAEITVPTLCVAGELDSVISSSAVAEMAAAIRNARYSNLAGVAHLPAYEDPRSLAELLRLHIE